MADDRFLQFARNYRWGTCAECPRDSDNHVYPECCKNTNRYDHHLNLEYLLRLHIIEKSRV